MRSFLAAAAATAALVTLAPTVASAHEESSSHEESTRDDESTDHDEPTRSLAEILLADSSKDGPDGFDRRPWDYDIVTQAVLLFPDLVAAASNPDAELTVFLPSDAAFRRLVHEITGQWVQGEADVFAAVASLGTDTVKNVLLYHILPAAISYRDARASDGAVVGTLLAGATIEVDVKGRKWNRVTLIDADTDDRDPRVVRGNVGGAATNGYAHGIDRVLRPIDLP